MYIAITLCFLLYKYAHTYAIMIYGVTFNFVGAPINGMGECINHS